MSRRRLRIRGEANKFELDEIKFSSSIFKKDKEINRRKRILKTKFNNDGVVKSFTVKNTASALANGSNSKTNEKNIEAHHVSVHADGLKLFIEEVSPPMDSLLLESLSEIVKSDRMEINEKMNELMEHMGFETSFASDDEFYPMSDFDCPFILDMETILMVFSEVNSSQSGQECWNFKSLWAVFTVFQKFFEIGQIDIAVDKLVALLCMLLQILLDGSIRQHPTTGQTLISLMQSVLDSISTRCNDIRTLSLSVLTILLSRRELQTPHDEIFRVCSSLSFQTLELESSQDEEEEHKVETIEESSTKSEVPTKISLDEDLIDTIELRNDRFKVPEINEADFIYLLHAIRWCPSETSFAAMLRKSIAIGCLGLLVEVRRISISIRYL
eukprot:TRINITY_DN4635_c0_g1_i2.p1 TRINITY_DN4635_c0_g1~~TRINITY_DN4635_c0_g1_i2.p1  ORF type:complete len:385 (+),score=56.52 TRINITY_DN4635_c0_g1_i2:49-1203(+)